MKSIAKILLVGAVAVMAIAVSAAPSEAAKKKADEGRRRPGSLHRASVLDDGGKVMVWGADNKWYAGGARAGLRRSRSARRPAKPFDRSTLSSGSAFAATRRPISLRARPRRAEVRVGRLSRRLTGRGRVLKNPAKRQTDGIVMKVRNSLKSLRGRHRDNKIVRRKGRVYVINKTQPRFKARQG